ncbi:unnamed protein product, partial [Chrysoparadoxa australica]
MLRSLYDLLLAKGKGGSRFRLLRRWSQWRTDTKITWAILACLVIYGGALGFSTIMELCSPNTQLNFRNEGAHMKWTTQRQEPALMGEKMKEQDRSDPYMTMAEELYGPTTSTIGLETCQAFRESASYNPHYRFLGIAGMYNTGTNLLEKLLLLNCRSASPQEQMEVKVVPWGKHVPVTWRKWFFAIPKPPSASLVRWPTLWRPVPLPIVMIKDPLTWMGSMCRARYDVHFGKDLEDPSHCPQLVKPDGDVVASNVAYNVAWKRTGNIIEYDSLVDVWNTWYEEWLDAQFPRLMVRFEDLLFHQEEMVREICTCSGGSMIEEFQAVAEQAK